MTRRTRPSLYPVMTLLLITPLLSACDAAENLIAPCDGCVDGVDLMVENVTVAEATFVEELQRHAVAAGTDIRVTVEIRNRGTDRSDQVELSVCAADTDSCVYPLAGTTVVLPPLKSNERITREVTLSLPANKSASPGALRARINVSDSDWSNNTRVLPLRVERPNFVPQLELLTSEAKVGTPIRAVVRIRNDSHVAGSAPTQFHVCSMRYSWQTECDGLDRLELTLPAVAARVVFVDTVEYGVPQSLLNHSDQGVSTILGACVDPLDAISKENQDSCVRMDYTALPNLELACGARPLEVGQPIAGELVAGDCSLSFDRYVDLYRIDANANSLWSVTLSSLGGESPWLGLGMRVLTARGSALSTASVKPGETYSFTVATAGTYYLAVHRWEAATYSFQVTQ